MNLTKDKKKGTWYVQFYYTDWQGNRKKKFKRGFKTKSEAQEWAMNFLQRQQQYRKIRGLIAYSIKPFLRERLKYK